MPPAGEAGASNRNYLQELQASEARFRNLIEKNADAMIVVGSDGLIRFANPAAAALLSRSAACLIGQPFGTPVVPGETTEVDIICASDRICVAEMRSVQTEWEGEVAFLASLRDTTERRTAEEALRFLAEAGQILAGSLDYPTTLASVVRLGVYYLADWCLLFMVREGQCLREAVASADPAAEDLARRLAGQPVPDHAAPVGIGHVLRTNRSVVLPELSHEILLTFASSPEDAAVLQALGAKAGMIVPLTARGCTLGAIAFLAVRPGRRYGEPECRLAEELARRAALALEHARLFDEATEAVRRRDEFLAMLAHELRNPLAPTLNAAQILRLRGIDPSLVRTLDVIERQTRHMARIIDDLLDISRITRGRIEIRKQPVPLATVIADAIQTSTPLIESRRHELSVALPHDPVWLDADPTRLAQVFANLLNNAAKYTEPGGRISVVAEASDAEIVIAVRDTGIGLAPDLLKRVFEPFVQAEHTLDRAQGGLGIGLTLVRGLVEMHGGKVEVSSAGLGKGSEFTVRLPRGLAPEVARTNQGRTPEQNRRIVVIEDNPDAREMLADLVSLWGHTVETAADGTQGVEMVLSNPPDVVLVDIGLPGVNGYEVARAIRQSLGDNQVFLVALTGYGQPADRRRALAAGFDAHLVKPINLDQLASLLGGETSMPS